MTGEKAKGTRKRERESEIEFFVCGVETNE